MKLDVNALSYLSKDDFRVLTAVEMGMRNHEIVPSKLIGRIASLKHGGTYKVLRNLLRHKLVHHDSTKYDGFRLTYLGYDYLAIKTLVNRGVFTSVGRQIGVGKESDVFEVANEDGTIMAMKLHRLGRVSFRAVKSKRDYLLHRNSFNWLYLSRLAALKEYAFMKALGEHGFPVPEAVDCNRHCVIMTLVQGYPLVQVRELQNPDDVFDVIIGLVIRLAEHGLIHCDFNEFNIMIDDNEKVTMIDFPQMVSVSHRNAKMYFDRDVECIFKFFRKRYNLTLEVDEADECEGSGSGNEGSVRPSFSSVAKYTGSLDKELAASGFTRKDQDVIEKFVEGVEEQHEDVSSDEEKLTDNGVSHDEVNEVSATKLQSLRLDDQNMNGANKEFQHISLLNISDAAETVFTEEHKSNNSDDDDSSKPGMDNETATPAGEEKRSDNDDEDSGSEEDPEFVKRLNKQRRKAIKAVHGSVRAGSSRNSYKDKGNKKSSNSIAQREACKW